MIVLREGYSVLHSLNRWFKQKLEDGNMRSNRRRYTYVSLQKEGALSHAMCHCSSLEQVRAVTAGEQDVPQLSSISTAPFTLSMSPACHVLPEGVFIFGWDPGGVFLSTVIIIIVAQVTHLYLILGKVTTAMQLHFSALLFLSQGILYFQKASCFLFQILLLKPSQMNLCGVRQRG